MNSFVAFAALLVISVVIISTVESTSMPRCESTCDLTKCRKVDCACGTHKDYCGCCDFCDRCKGEPCNFFGFDRCTEGTKCVSPYEEGSIDWYNRGGQCQ